MTTVVIASLLILLVIVLLRAAVRHTVFFLAATATHIPGLFAGSPAGARLRAVASWLAERYPTLVAFVAKRFDPHQQMGLPVTLIGLAALYLAALFSGLTEDLLEAQGTIRSDNTINAALGAWRIEPFVTAFRWITTLGGTQAIIAAVVLATGFLWSQRRTNAIIALWVTCLGAVATTTVGKLLIARHRPEFLLDVHATGWSFPSGHATAATAVYGFIAFAVARTSLSLSAKVEFGYWSAVLIVLIGFSRIFLGVHYVTDVIGGFLVGGFWLLIGFSIAEWRRAPLPSPPSCDVSRTSLVDDERNT